VKCKFKKKKFLKTRNLSLNFQILERKETNQTIQVQKNKIKEIYLILIMMQEAVKAQILRMINKIKIQMIKKFKKIIKYLIKQ
jgi:hypothetical protein